MRVVRKVLGVLLAALVVPAAAGAASYAKGVDVSNWNGSIDWIQVAGDGYSFLFAKATEGVTFTDVTYAINRAGAQGVGLRLGAYHFARPEGSSEAAQVADALAEADHFVDVAQPRAGDLPPVLDLETRGGLGQAGLVRWTEAFLDQVKARTGVDALVYASPSFWRTSLGDTQTFALAGHRLWVAHWTAAALPLVPASNWGGQGWSFWQWTNCAKVPGFARCGDGNRVNGPSPIPFALPAFPAGPPVAGTPPAVVGTARAGARLAAVPGTWSGGKPVSFTYQWSSCDAAGGGCAPIPGATLATYTPAAADVGHGLTVSVTAAGARGTATATSAPTLAIAPAGAAAAARPAVVSPPSVTGTAQVGQALTGAAGAWTGSPTSFAYQWRRCDAAGAGCVPIAGATGAVYVLTPGDAGATLSLLVTATGSGGAQAATAPPTATVAAAPVPPAVAGSLVAPAGAAGAVATGDARATVTWQPGAVPAGTTVRLAEADAAPALRGTGVALTLEPAQRGLPWPVDVAYAAAPSDQVIAFSADGRVWLPVAPLPSPALPGTLRQGAYLDGGVLHVLTRDAGRIALFRPGRWGDPRRISPRAPVLRRLTAKATRQRDGSVLLLARLSTSSQAHLYASASAPILSSGSRVAGGSARQALVLRSGAFPLRLRLKTRGRLVRVRLTAVDPWGRRGAFTLSLRVP